MAKSISVNKKSRGRPKKAGGVDPVSAVRLPMDLTEQVDLWGEGQKLSRSEAIRRLVELGLTLKTKGHQSKEGQKKRAHEMAGTAIDDMMDTATSPDDQASRKRRLLKGPEELRNVGVDRPKRSP